MGTYALTAWHTEGVHEHGQRTLSAMRRTLLGLLQHGFIKDLETYEGEGETTWSWHRGTEPGKDLMEGLADSLRIIAPHTWLIETKLEEGP